MYTRSRSTQDENEKYYVMFSRVSLKVFKFGIIFGFRMISDLVKMDWRQKD